MSGNSTVWKIITGLLIAVILYLSFCNKRKSDIGNDTVVPKERIIENVRVDTVESNKGVDRLNRSIAFLESENIKTISALQKEKSKSLFFQQQNTDLVNEVKDEKLKNDLLVSGKNLKDNSDLKDSLCDLSIRNLSTQLSEKTEIINLNQGLYRKIKANLDTALSNQRILENQVKKSKPVNKLSAGVIVNAYPVLGVGVAVDFMHKKGMVYGIGVTNNNGIIHGQLAFKKVISLKK